MRRGRGKRAAGGVMGQLWGAKTEKLGADHAGPGATGWMDFILSSGVRHMVLSRRQL